MAKILWIEDEANKIAGLVRPLIKDGHTIDVAADVGEAQTQLERVLYDIILLDIVIPLGVDQTPEEIDPYEGVKLLDFIRRGEHSNTPVIVLSVVNDSNVIREVKKLGVQEILRKGALLPSELRSEVQRVLAMSSGL